MDDLLQGPFRDPAVAHVCGEVEQELGDYLAAGQLGGTLAFMHAVVRQIGRPDTMNKRIVLIDRPLGKGDEATLKAARSRAYDLTASSWRSLVSARFSACPDNDHAYGNHVSPLDHDYRGLLIVSVGGLRNIYCESAADLIAAKLKLRFNLTLDMIQRPGRDPHSTMEMDRVPPSDVTSTRVLPFGDRPTAPIPKL